MSIMIVLLIRKERTIPMSRTESYYSGSRRMWSDITVFTIRKPKSRQSFVLGTSWHMNTRYMYSTRYKGHRLDNE